MPALSTMFGQTLILILSIRGKKKKKRLFFCCCCRFGFSLILIQYFIYMKFKASQHQCIAQMQADAGEKGRRWVGGRGILGDSEGLVLSQVVVTWAPSVCNWTIHLHSVDFLICMSAVGWILVPLEWWSPKRCPSPSAGECHLGNGPLLLWFS